MKTRFFFKHKIILILLGIPVLILFSMIGIRGFNRITHYNSPQWIGEYHRCIDTEEKVVALTYDDGPSPLYTPLILDTLKKYNVKATFFVLGSNAKKYTFLLERMRKEGHEIGSHSWIHEELIFKSPDYIEEQITRTDSMIRATGYDKEIYFRAPHGAKFIVLPWILHKLQKKHIAFNVVPIDWEGYSVQNMFTRFKSQVKPGSIILLHDAGQYKGDTNRYRTVELTGKIISELHRQNYKICLISELLKYQQP